MTGQRGKTLFAQLAFLLTSRTRQRDVMGPGWIMLIVGVLLALDALVGPAIPATITQLLMVVLSLWAGFTGWQRSRASHSREHLLAVGLLMLGAVLSLLGMNTQFVWAALLAAFALRLLVDDKSMEK